MSRDHDHRLDPDYEPPTIRVRRIDSTKPPLSHPEHKVAVHQETNGNGTCGVWSQCSMQDHSVFISNLPDSEAAEAKRMLRKWGKAHTASKPAPGPL